jgi:hypothetical protein
MTKMIRNIIATSLILMLGIPFHANAEIEKIAIPCDNTVCFYWWPKLAAIKGWHNDQALNVRASANILVPVGDTFSDAETVIYAKALYKPRIPKTKSLEMLIDDDKNHFIRSFGTMDIREVDPLTTGDGKRFRSFTFFPEGEGSFEQVTYGEEGEFYLIFTVSSKTMNGYRKSMKIYKELIKQYREAP